MPLLLPSTPTEDDLLEIKDSITALIGAQLETQMMAKIDEDYTLSILEPPFVPEEKFSPRRSIICIFGTFLGGLFAIFYILMNHFFVRGNENT